MQPLDLVVIRQAREWLEQGQRIWLATVTGTYGSSPRPPGSMLVVNATGEHCGSLSGGCVEAHFIDAVRADTWPAALTTVSYGGVATGHTPEVSLPCGGSLDILIERFDSPARTPFSDDSPLQLLQRMEAALSGAAGLIRSIDLQQGTTSLSPDLSQGLRVQRQGQQLQIRVGALYTLLIAGISTVSRYCAEFALTLGFTVIVCDPRPELCEQFTLAGVQLLNILPSRYLEQHGAHQHTAIVALTHDPRIDDLAMMEAVLTQAFYIGVMGSQRTSDHRRERLRRIGGLSEQELTRIHAPVGMAIGSKTPAEIALSVMADILRVRNGCP
ncbi:XdhC family protein [Pokkaliibacter sp. MBI-7]|uniref:XdhC family protein n=1 Tax=Pokkaliibacter sp. MBI-7 TaxID=3040600 RepID=UPI002448473F|nr:XdhC family protein [Pokkaliibacter sp. MBI-7]MDH2436321.1 XdhC family protein [Pokkaliibacter sp. MBI-7]